MDTLKTTNTMDWEVSIVKPAGQQFYRAYVKCPSGFRRDCTSTQVTSDHENYQLRYIVDDKVLAASNDLWELPIRYTGGASREVEVQAIMLGGALLGKDRVTVEDGA